MEKNKYICSMCGNEFEVKEINPNIHLASQLMFCSNECRAKHNKEVMASRYNLIPPRYRDIESDNVELVNECLEKSVFIYGASGSGKTCAMANAIRKLIDKGKRVSWISYPELITELRSLFISDDAEYTPNYRIRQIADFDGVLALDDVFAENLTNYTKETTYDIINHREQHRLNTLITSNYSLDEIDKMIGRTIASRIQGVYLIRKLNDNDRRLQIKDVDK